MTLSLPDTAVAGDSGHVADHNLLSVALGTVDTHLTATTDHIPSGAVALGDVAATYTDESVGRRIFTWDTVNSRWQLTYGDTGWRNVSAALINGWTGTVYLRRITRTVFMQVEGLDGAAKTNNNFVDLPSGWNSDHARLLFYTFAPAIVRGDAGPYNLASCVNSTDVHYGNFSWITNDAWPASLPGSASGSIPYA